MVQFGQNPSQGTLLRASQFLLGTCINAIFTSMLTSILYGPLTKIEELPVRLAHRAKELDELPHDMSSMPSIQKVKNWYGQSFEVRNHAPFLCHLGLGLKLITPSLLGTDQLPSHLYSTRYPQCIEPRRHLLPHLYTESIFQGKHVHPQRRWKWDQFKQTPDTN
jgi:hypothetical protein